MTRTRSLRDTGWPLFTQPTQKSIPPIPFTYENAAYILTESLNLIVNPVVRRDAIAKAIPALFASILKNSIQNLMRHLQM